MQGIEDEEEENSEVETNEAESLACSTELDAITATTVPASRSTITTSVSDSMIAAVVEQVEPHVKRHVKGNGLRL